MNLYLAMGNRSAISMTVCDINRYEVELVVESFIRRNHYLLPGISSKFSSWTMSVTDLYIMCYFQIGKAADKSPSRSTYSNRTEIIMQ